jgi:transcriptional regulator with XRE-family HTH domain
VTAVLWQRRLERGLTRAELAFAAQVSAQTLAKIEQGKSTDSGFTLIATIAATLGLGLDELLELAQHAAAADDQT